MSSQSRRQRRSFAKQMGYLGKIETVSELLQRTKRSSDFGKQLHTLHLERSMNDQLETERIKKQFSEESEIELARFGQSTDEPSLVLSTEAFSFLGEVKASGPEPSPSGQEQGKDNV